MAKCKLWLNQEYPIPISFEEYFGNDLRAMNGWITHLLLYIFFGIMGGLAVYFGAKALKKTNPTELAIAACGPLIWLKWIFDCCRTRIINGEIPVGIEADPNEVQGVFVINEEETTDEEDILSVHPDSASVN